MSDQYHIDLAKYSLEKFKNNLKSREMIPSRAALKNDLDERFRIIENSGISNHKELIDVLKTKQKIAHYSEITGLPVEYLTLLNREAKSYLSNPTRLDKFPRADSDCCEKLESVGIKNTRHLFNVAKDKADRIQLSQTTGIPIETLNELVGLSDLSRAYGVGPMFARMIYDMGIKSIKDFVSYTPVAIIKIYEDQTDKKADFGVKDIEFSLELAKELEIAVEL